MQLDDPMVRAWIEHGERLAKDHVLNSENRRVQVLDYWPWETVRDWTQARQIPSSDGFNEQVNRLQETLSGKPTEIIVPPLKDWESWMRSLLRATTFQQWLFSLLRPDDFIAKLWSKAKEAAMGHKDILDQTRKSMITKIAEAFFEVPTIEVLLVRLHVLRYRFDEILKDNPLNLPKMLSTDFKFITQVMYLDPIILGGALSTSIAVLLQQVVINDFKETGTVTSRRLAHEHNKLVHEAEECEGAGLADKLRELLQACDKLGNHFDATALGPAVQISLDNKIYWNRFEGVKYRGLLPDFGRSKGRAVRHMAHKGSKDFRKFARKQT